MLRKHLLAALCAAGFLLPAVASAQYPWYGPIAGGYGGYDNGLVYPFFYRVRSIPTPPYFSLHPPVYYGPRILYRPYGNSPFAYPSWYERPTVGPETPAGPKFIVNPYYRPKNDSETREASYVPAEARAVANPFVAASR